MEEDLIEINHNVQCEDSLLPYSRVKKQKRPGRCYPNERKKKAKEEKKLSPELEVEGIGFFTIIITPSDILSRELQVSKITRNKK